MAQDLPVRLLFDAIEAGRAALRERDERDVPAKLRTVAASSSRTLPPPLARRLLSEIDADEDLRAEAADQLGESAGQASVLFLQRPEAWESQYDELIDAHRSRVGERAADQEQRRVSDLERDLKTTRSKLKDAIKRAEAAEAKAEERVAESRRDIKKAGKAAARRAAELEEDLQRSESLRRDLDDEIDVLRKELGMLRAQREKRTKPSEAVEARPVVGSDPVSMARALDDLMVRVQQHHEPASSEDPSDRSLVLPPGIAPDRADAVEWLLGSGAPQVWIVDGHNLAHRLDPARFTDPRLREEVAEVFARLRRQSLGPLRAEVIFDTGAPVGDSVQASPGVDVRFVGDADAEVVRLAAIHGHQAVVVSSDGEVREGAGTAGAVVIWSEALLEFLRS